MRQVAALWRWLMAFLLLAGLALFLDLDRLWLELQRLPASLLLPVLALTVFQVGLSAWRWRYTAKRLGLQMSYSRAFREYYLASFLNQVLPGGVMGDAGRAWRHSRETDKKLGAVHAVIIERLSGQFALFLVVAWAVAWLSESGRFSPNLSVGWLLPVVAIGSLAVGLWGMRSKNRAGRYIRRLCKDLSQTLFGWQVLPIQLGTSLLVLGSYLAVFFLLAQQAGYIEREGSGFLMLALCSLLLLSMVIPLTVAGWGVREGAAAVLWPLAGLPAEQGVALSVAYGVLVLISSFPGLAVLLRRQSPVGVKNGNRLTKTPGQTTYRCPD